MIMSLQKKEYAFSESHLSRIRADWSSVRKDIFTPMMEAYVPSDILSSSLRLRQEIYKTSLISCFGGYIAWTRRRYPSKQLDLLLLCSIAEKSLHSGVETSNPFFLFLAVAQR